MEERGLQEVLLFLFGQRMMTVDVSPLSLAMIQFGCRLTGSRAYHAWRKVTVAQDDMIGGMESGMLKIALVCLCL